jgi:hypothetical protein
VTDVTADVSRPPDGAADLPGWLPPLVKEHARMAYAAADTPEDAAIVRRVTTHEDMRSVWKELLKRRAAAGHYVYPVQDPDPARRRPVYAARRAWTRTDWLQQRGLAELSIRLTRLGRRCAVRPLSSDDLFSSTPLPNTDDLRDVQDAALLADQAQRYVLDCLRHIEDASCVAMRLKAAQHLVRAADCLNDIEERRQTDNDRAVLTGVINIVADAVFQLFGPDVHLYGQTAIMASVVLQRDVSPEYVRGVTRGWQRF